jgi:hypothetical protein
MNFIFMLTVDDKTVPNCLELFDQAEALGLHHVGFKDVGVERGVLHELTRRIKASGATSYLEVVSTSPEATLKSARAAVEIGVDRLMGGTDAERILDIVKEADIRYYPFAGRPNGHPTRLGGSADDVAADCRRFERLGCAGVDLLAYRATDADPLELVRAARSALAGELIVAGSIDTSAQILALRQAGVDGFTIGTAAIKDKFQPSTPGLARQLEAVLNAYTYQ